MRHIPLIAAALILLAMPALADSPATNDLKADWQAYATAQAHVANDITALMIENQALAAENVKLKAEAVKPDPEKK